jgi:hypothetical protein
MLNFIHIGHLAYALVFEGNPTGLHQTIFTPCPLTKEELGGSNFSAAMNLEVDVYLSV